MGSFIVSDQIQSGRKAIARPNTLYYQETIMADSADDKSLQEGDAKILKSLGYMGLGIFISVIVLAGIALVIIK